MKKQNRFIMSLGTKKVGSDITADICTFPVE